MKTSSLTGRARIEPLEARIAPAVIFAVTETQQLISFDSAAPGTILATVAISGLSTPGTERMEAIDFRPATGQLYGLGINNTAGDDEGRIYTIDPLTGVATQVGAAAFSTALTDSADYGFDFDPVRDVLRVVNAGEQNFRVNPNDGALIMADTALDLAAGAEAIYGAAYDRNFSDATATTLYGLDFAGDRLVRIGDADGAPGSPDGGVLTTVGPLGLATNSLLGGFDIESRAGTGFAAIFTSGTGATGLYTINLTTGAATLVAHIGTGATKVRGLTAALPGDLTVAADGKSAAYKDFDGDNVTIAVGKGALGAGQFTFATGALGSQLLRLSFANNQTFADASVTFAATPQGGKGDGFAHVGYIDASGVDLGKVTVDGDLGQIDAGDGADGDTALAALTVHSMGALGTSTQLPGADLLSQIAGRLGALNVKTDLLGARIEAIGTVPSIGNVVIGGDLVGGHHPSIGAGVFSFGALGHVTLGGSIVGGSTAFDGAIQGMGVGNVTIGGSILGGSGVASGQIKSVGNMGAVVIKGDLVGGSVGFSGGVGADGDLASVTLGGSLIGGTVVNPLTDVLSGVIQAGGKILGAVKIGGDIVSGNGGNSGILTADSIGPVTVGGSVSGLVPVSGAIVAVAGGIASVKIAGDLRSAPIVLTAGSISATGPIGAVTIGGSMVGGSIVSGVTLGAVTIGGDLRAETNDVVSITAAGIADSKVAAIKSVTVKGSVVSAAINAGGFPANPDASMGPVTVGGNWIASNLTAGTAFGANGRVGNADDVKAAGDNADTIFSRLGSITIGGFVAGTVGPVSSFAPDHFGFVAEQIDALKIGGVKVPLTAGLDKAGFALGVTDDVRVREVDDTPAVFPTNLAPADNPRIYAVDENNHLISFRADAPGTILSSVTLVGLAAGESVAGIDFRPATGELYALGITNADAGPDSGRLLHINPDTNVTTPFPAFSTTLADGDRYGFDFDPVTDRIRVVTIGDGNFRLNPTDGTLAGTDTALDDPANFEVIYGAAYDRNFAGAGAATLYGLDFNADFLVRIGDVGGTPGSADGGVVTRIGAGLGFSAFDEFGGFDIEARTGAGFAVAFSTIGPNPNQTSLHRIDLATGAATIVAAVGSTAHLRGVAIAPSHDLAITGNAATFTDVDGDRVTVKSSKPGLSTDDFIFVTGERGSQLQRLDLDDEAPAFTGADVTITAAPFLGKGDGFANVGHIDATGIDLGKVSVDGDFARITAGAPAAGGIAVASLTAHSMGLLGASTLLPGDSLVSELDGRLGALFIKTDLVNASISTTGAAGTMGSVFIGGSVIGGDAKSGVFSAGAMGNVKLGGSLVGGSVDESGRISSGGAMGKVTLRGSLLGGTATDTGIIESGAAMGAVAIRGEILGGTKNETVVVTAAGRIASVTIGGSIAGGTVTPGSLEDSGIIYAGELGSVKVGGSLLGSNGNYSGTIYSLGKLGAVSVAGSVVGGTGSDSSGAIIGEDGIASVKIGRDVRGGAGVYSGSIYNFSGDIGAITIGGSLSGFDAADSGIYSARNLGVVKIGGSVRGDVPGGVRIQAEGLIDPPSAAKAVAIAGLNVKGSVRGALLLAGYDDINFDTAVNPDAAIGAVSIGGNLVATSLVAGVASASFPKFGDGTDTKAPGEAVADAIFSRIANVIAKGFALGTPGVSGDHFGFVAEQIGKLTIGAYKAPLTAGTDTAGFAITSDLRVREV